MQHPLMTKLRSWRHKRKLRLADLQAQLARRKIRVSLATLSRLERGLGLNPDTAALFRAVEELTSRQVKVADLIPELST